MRMGLVGYGGWGRFHAWAMAAAGAGPAAICCRDSAGQRAAAADHPGAEVMGDWRHLVARDDVDAVDIVVPNHLHCEIGVAALEAGKDVLLEKPMAVSLAECDRLIDAAAANERVLSVGHQLRLSTQWGAVKQLIEAGEIGRPRYASFSLFRFPFRPGADGWRRDPARVGSWLLEEPVHFLDLMLWYFADAGDPVDLRAVANGPCGADGLWDNVTIQLRFADGAYASVTQSLTGFENHFTLELAGETGSLRTWWSGVMDRTYEPSFELKVKSAADEAPRTIDIAASGEVFELEAQLAQVIRAFAERRALVTGADGRRAVALCLAAAQSLAEDREVRPAL